MRKVSINDFDVLTLLVLHNEEALVYVLTFVVLLNEGVLVYVLSLVVLHNEGALVDFLTRRFDARVAD